MRTALLGDYTNMTSPLLADAERWRGRATAFGADAAVFAVAMDARKLGAGTA